MIVFHTPDPNALLEAFVEGVTERRIRTWIQDDDGDFTHAPSQWRDKAWMRPRVRRNRLTFTILWNGDFRGTKEIYGVYHGRLIEAMLSHFDELFDRAEATALIDGDDGMPPQSDS